jgi:hypothetical protein
MEDPAEVGTALSGVCRSVGSAAPHHIHLSHAHVWLKFQLSNFHACPVLAHSSSRSSKRGRVWADTAISAACRNSRSCRRRESNLRWMLTFTALASDTGLPLGLDGRSGASAGCGHLPPVCGSNGKRQRHDNTDDRRRGIGTKNRDYRVHGRLLCFQELSGVVAGKCSIW